MTRTGRRPTTPLTKEAFDDPVLEGMEGDDRKTSAGAQRTFGRHQTVFELVELGIEMNPYGLEGAGRRIALLSCTVAPDGPADEPSDGLPDGSPSGSLEEIAR